MIKNALITSIHQGSLSCSGTGHLHALSKPCGVLVLDSDDTCPEPSVESRREQARGAVGSDLDRLPCGDLPRARIGRRELHLRERALKLQLRDALHCGAAEEPAVADDLEPAAGPRALS